MHHHRQIAWLKIQVHELQIVLCVHTNISSIDKCVSCVFDFYSIKTVFSGVSTWQIFSWWYFGILPILPFVFFCACMRVAGKYLSLQGSSYTVRVSVSAKQIKNIRVTSVDKVLKTPWHQVSLQREQNSHWFLLEGRIYAMIKTYLNPALLFMKKTYFYPQFKTADCEFFFTVWR